MKNKKWSELQKRDLREMYVVSLIRKMKLSRLNLTLSTKLLKQSRNGEEQKQFTNVNIMLPLLRIS